MVNMTTTPTPWCCFLTCDEDADFTIYTQIDPNGTCAGPDPYSDSTDACVLHVGPLLGHQPDIHPDNVPLVEWRVLPLGKSWD